MLKHSDHFWTIVFNQTIMRPKLPSWLTTSRMTMQMKRCIARVCESLSSLDSLDTGVVYRNGFNSMEYEAGIAVGSAEVPAEEKNEKAHPMSLRACVCLFVFTTKFSAMNSTFLSGDEAKRETHTPCNYAEELEHSAETKNGWYLQEST